MHHFCFVWADPDPTWLDLPGKLRQLKPARDALSRTLCSASAAQLHVETIISLPLPPPPPSPPPPPAHSFRFLPRIGRGFVDPTLDYGFYH